MIAGVGLLLWSIRHMLAMLKASELVRVPLQPDQELTFSSSGPAVLCVEGPLFTRRFAGLEFNLQTEYGQLVPVRKHWFCAKSSGFAKIRMQLQTYQLPHPGRYRLRIDSLGERQTNDAEHAIVFIRPHLAATVGYILAILFAAWLLIGGIVMFALHFLTS